MLEELESNLRKLIIAVAGNCRDLDIRLDSIQDQMRESFYLDNFFCTILVFVLQLWEFPPKT